MDIDEKALREARSELGTATINETVNQALRRVAGTEADRVRRSLDHLAHADLVPREDAWR